MYIIGYLLPLLALGAAFLWGADTDYWWAYALITLGAEGLVFLVFYLKTHATEYLSGYVTRVEHHYAWVERRETTEYKTDRNGKSYTVKKVEYIDHPPEYYYFLNTGKQRGTSSNYFWNMCKRWGTGRSHISVYHPNCVRGGGGEACYWDGREYNTDTETYTHRYRNPVKNSHSVFRGQRISKEQAQKLGLFDYPAASGEQQVVLPSAGLKYTGDLSNANFELQHLNAFCGSLHEIHAFILLFPAKAGVGIALKQRDYWEGCNKNEFVVCLGVSGKKVEWCHTLSWMDEPKLDVAVKDYFLQNDTPSLTSFVLWLRDNIHLWKRKEFKDFKYLGWNMSQSGSSLFWTTALATALVSLLCSFWIGGWPAENRRRQEAVVAAERQYQEEQRLTDEVMRRAPGTYYLAVRAGLYKVEIEGNGTFTAREISTYSYRGYGGTRYWQEDGYESGTWTVGDPRARLDIVLHSRAFGYTDIRITNNQVYEVKSYDGDKSISNCLTEAEYESQMAAAREKYSGTRWEKDTTASWIYDDEWGLPHRRYYDFRDWIVFNADGTFQSGGPLHYNPYDREEIRVSGTWELVPMKPESGERYDIVSGGSLGLVLRVSSRDKVPQWINNLDYVSDRRDYDTREFLIPGGGAGVSLPGCWHEDNYMAEDAEDGMYEGVVSEEEIIEAERDIPE